MKKYDQIYLIDDNKIDLLINKMLVQRCNADLKVTSFIDPQEALSHFQNLDHNAILGTKNIIFLDFFMPNLNGTQFMDLFQKLDPLFRTHFEIYVLSSTIDPNEIKKITSHTCCTDYLYKPLDSKFIDSLLNGN